MIEYYLDLHNDNAKPVTLMKLEHENMRIVSRIRAMVYFPWLFSYQDVGSLDHLAFLSELEKVEPGVAAGLCELLSLSSNLLDQPSRSSLFTTLKSDYYPR